MSRNRFLNLFFIFLLLVPSISFSSCAHFTAAAKDWYEVTEFRPNVFLIREPSEIDANFFILRAGDKALFIDSGIGLGQKVAEKLLSHLGIKTFQIINTHAHYDHVGLNYLAEKVSIGKKEWEKYQRLSEKNQTEHFLRLEPHGPRPHGFDPLMKQKPWQPSEFIIPGKNISFGSFVLTPILAPGHTEGHIIFYEPHLNLLFTGDLVYDGLNYLHLADSSLSAYEASLENLVQFISEHPKVTLLPCHNSIPLDLGYPAKVLALVRDIKASKIAAKRTDPANAIFKSGRVFDKNGVKLILKD